MVETGCVFSDKPLKNLSDMIIRHLLIIAACTLFSNLYAGPVYKNQGQTPSVFDSFYSEDVLSVILETDLDALINDRRREDFQTATITYEDADKKTTSWTVEVKPRGKFRRRICDFPPVKLKFDKDELAAAGLNGHNDLKLVTHCLDDKQEGRDNVMREFLAYEMYNLLTPNSYRVQLVRIEYRDTEGNIRPIKRYGFLLEDTDEMAERLGGEECDTCVNPDPARLDPKEENLLSVFQYMIGNGDWSLTMARNVKFIELSSGRLVPVPFDFDFSGLVDASYAIPNREYGQWDLQSRVYMGLQPDKDLLIETLAKFARKKKDLYTMVRQHNGLKKDTRIFITAYLDRFFYAIENGTEEELMTLFTPATMNVPITPAPDSSKTDNSGGINR